MSSVPRRERILIVDDDPGIAEVVQLLLKGEGFATEHCGTIRAATRQVAVAEPDLVIMDLKLPDGVGIDAISSLRSIQRELPIILMTSYSSIESAVAALRAGAVDYIIKPFDNTDFVHAVERALNERRISRENALLKKSLRSLYGVRQMIGESAGIRRVQSLMRKVALSDASVLIAGESGTGKELVALGLHYTSPRADGPFVPINCAAIPSELMESELFGHAKGAFTGAVERSEGLIREAHGGTLFLDEVSELALPLQVKLLRVLQDRLVRPVGGRQVHSVDVRFVAATNRDLQQAMQTGAFRKDIFYRLNVISIEVPPLRERGDDVKLLAAHFIEQHARKLGKPVRRMDRDFEHFLMRYHWPGNVRELENLIECAVILADSGTLDAGTLAEVAPRTEPAPALLAAGAEPLSVEEYIRSVVERFQGTRGESELARLLGIGRKAIWMRRKQWGLQRERKPEI
ncbi:MAG: sigma-54-dependent Fis family transcriptional regulator [Betaproteobacteria bacterium]|nr:sigma-54-dependent Fis family transcriptional regulator [Betaproteobacteria bacterium]